MAHIPRVLIAGDRSSAGKTTISTGIMADLRDSGYTVQPYKVGLDFIDPSYHTEVTGRYSRNLDGYLMTGDAVLEVFSHAAAGADIAVIEGVRGLFEGLEATSDIGSTAQIAKMLGCPVILVINARSITRSAAAVALGYKMFDPDVNIAGVILNNIGGGRHGEKAKQAVETYTGIDVIGMVPRSESMSISMRHLGLIPALEGRRRHGDFDARIGGIKKIIRESIDLERIVRIAGTAPPLADKEPVIFRECDENSATIGVALDEAFNFYYKDNLDLLELCGAKVSYFSPVHDSGIPDVDGLYIGGGYPELFARELAENQGMRSSIAQASAEGMPIYAECGGLMYLTHELTTGLHGRGTYHMAEMPEGTYEMVGAVPGKTVMGHARVVSYNSGSFVADTPIGRKGSRFIGHEFHHSALLDIPESATFAIRLERGTGIKDNMDGILVRNTLAAYAHLHAASYTGFAREFVRTCSR